jgi:uncharacterized protein (DUF1810 family)
MTDARDLQRFLDAQEPVIEQVKRELRNGRKTSHWMWFVFPQIAGLGRSEMARRYAIASREEAAAYLAHPILGVRLHDCTRLLMLVEGRSAHDIFGSPDDMKFHSCMTLFASVARDDEVFGEALYKYFAGNPDRLTLDILAKEDNAPNS